MQALLLRLNCPTPLHALRTLLLGNISSPRLDVSPMAPLAQALGGELPEFNATAEAEEVVQALVHGLWNRLADHQRARVQAVTIGGGGRARGAERTGPHAR